MITFLLKNKVVNTTKEVIPHGLSAVTHCDFQISQSETESRTFFIRNDPLSADLAKTPDVTHKSLFKYTPF